MLHQIILKFQNRPRQSHSISIDFLWIAINIFGIALVITNKTFKIFLFNLIYFSLMIFFKNVNHIRYLKLNV